MKKRRLFGCIAVAIMLSGSAIAQNNGGINSQMLKELSDSYNPTTAERHCRTSCSHSPSRNWH